MINIKLKKSGFSLVEVIIAVFLVGVMIIIIANIPQAIKIITNSQSESIIREIAAKKIEDIRLSGYSNLVYGTTSFTDPRFSSLTLVNATSTIIDCPVTVCTQNELVKQATLNISWKELDKQKNFQISTLVAKDGLR